MKIIDTTPRSPWDDSTLSSLFNAVLTPYAGRTVPVGTLVEALHERGFGVMLLLFALPLAIPIPKPPPIDTLMGLPLFYLCMQMILGRDRPSLPKKIMDYTIQVDFLIRAFTRGRPWLERFERLFHPRLTETFSDHMLSRICGVLGIGLTGAVIVPFPLSNTVPSICMVIMATGIVNRDGLAALAAGIFGTIWVIGLAFLAFFGFHFLSGLL